MKERQLREYDYDYIEIRKIFKLKEDEHFIDVKYDRGMNKMVVTVSVI